MFLKYVFLFFLVFSSFSVSHAGPLWDKLKTQIHTMFNKNQRAKNLYERAYKEYEKGEFFGMALYYLEEAKEKGHLVSDEELAKFQEAYAKEIYEWAYRDYEKGEFGFALIYLQGAKKRGYPVSDDELARFQEQKNKTEGGESCQKAFQEVPA